MTLNIHECLMECISKALNRQGFDGRTDLFESGLSSVGRAMKLLSLLSGAFSRPVSLRDLRDHPTPEALEAFLSAAPETEEPLPRPDYPLTQTQLGILAESLASPDSTVYNVPLLLRLSPRVDLPRLKKAVESAIAAHPYLNATIFADETGSYRVRRNDTPAPEVELAETDALPEKLVLPFDLLGGRLYRARIFGTGAGSYLFLDCHHILCDGNSLVILVRDIGEAYEGRSLPPERRTGFDLALEEEALRETELLARDKAYYDALLSETDREMLPLGDVWGRPESSNLFTVESRLSLDSLRSFLRENRLSAAAFFDAAFAFVLSRFTGREDALFTTVWSGRNDSRLDRTVSMMVKTVPVFCRLEEQQTAVELVSGMGRQLLRSASHDLFSFADIAREYGIVSDVLFAWQGDGFAFDTVCGEPAEALLYGETEGDAKTPLLVEAFVRQGRIRFRCSHRSDRFSEDFVRRFIVCLEHAAESFLNNPRLKDVSLLDEAAVAEMDAFNGTSSEDPVRDIVSMFRETAEKFPDRPAVVYKDAVYTYRRADELSDRIAGFLRGQGVGKGDVVSVLIPRCEWMTMASLGVLKAGAAYQPLDPSYPPERLTFMMKDAACKLLIADESLLEIVSGEYQGPVLRTKDIPALPPCERPADHPDPEDAFILLYTSGSTGTPKGVILEHRNLCNFCQWYQRYYGLDETGRVAAYASYGFDADMMDQYPALTCGACVYIVEEEIRLDLPVLEDWYRRSGITHAFMTTQVGRQFYAMADLPNLKYLSVGGEKLVPLPPQPGNPEFCNVYGPTECTILTTLMPVDRLYDRVPIGKPIGNYRCYVVDRNLRRLPPLVPGELLVAGRGVGRGYLNRPEQTEKAFIRNPFSEDPEYARAYRTGDVVRLLPDGNIDFIGRNDGQVKVRGFRIELTEVEGVVREFPGIRDATVQAFEDAATGEKFIAAYVVSDSEVDVEAMNRFIAERKPPYMVPAVTVQLPEIPLNQNQKVNKKALPRPEPKPRAKKADAGPAAPLNLLEQALKDIVAEIVNTSDFGITDRFGDLGLSSISGIRLAVQLYRRYGVQLNARELVSSGTLQSVENEILAALLRKEDASAPEASAAGEPAGKEVPKSCRLSFAQQGVYAECQAAPESTRYNIPFALKMPAGIRADQLREAVSKVVAAHPYLLCRFVPDEHSEIVQEPIPDCTLEIPVREMSPEEVAAYKTAFVRPFDLAKGPVIRFEIIQSDALYLLMDLHHLVSDGASVDLFLSQLCRALDGAALEEEHYTYYDFVAEEKIGPEVEDFFAGRMAEMEEATQLIPDVFEEGLPHTEKSVSVPTGIAAVKEFARRHGLTPAAVYLAAAEIVYGRYVCEDTVAIATISNGRSNLKLSETMGMFVNTLPLVTVLDHQEETLSFLRRVAENYSDTIAHENYPFARIAAKYDFHPMASYTCQIGVINEYATKAGPLEVESLELGIAKVAVGIYIEGTEEEARIRVAYDVALYSEAMMRSLAESVENVVQGLLTAKSVAEISLAGEAQCRVLDGFNKPWDLDYNKEDTAVTVFRRTARANPDKVAALYRDKTYTYRQLDEITDRLAAKLYRKACGITGKTSLAEEVVSILLPRDENVFILPLAALKAGLAYEPLDPGYPRERLNFMVKDAGACLLLADDSLRDLVDEYEGAVMTVSELCAAEEAAETPVPPKPEDLFIMLYTSGSTGTPKGCQLEHRNLVSYAHGVRNDFYRSDDRIAAYASFGFDVNMSDIFCTLLNGGTVCLIPEDLRMNLGALAAYFDEVGVTAALLTTQVGVQFLQNYPDLKSLRMLVMGGEKLPAVDPSRISYTIVNGYGPTENCCGVSLFPIHAWEPNIPIGKPMATIHGYILDKTGHRLPAGAAGEYCLSGPQVSRGYLNRPDKTAEAYEPSPFDEFRIYHTGDIVRYRQNGDVEFVGRKDGQVKIRGFRIETKEIEAVIRGFEGISDVTVQAYDFETGGKYLAAFVVSDAPVDTAKLADFIRERKPAYMVPPVIMQIDAIPLTVNQKVDKKALPKPNLQKTGYVAPQGRAEEDFCAVFAGVLGLERVGAEDDFFEVGGNSILAMKVVLAAEKAGWHIVYNDVFSHTTPKALAAFVGGAEEAPAPAPARENPPAGSVPEVDQAGYDYRQIHDLLSRNTLEAFRSGEPLPLQEVLLLGGTGYLGSHVLHELILHHPFRLWCLVRPGRAESGESRLKATLRGYFGEDYASLFGDRITVLEGDATDPAVLSGWKAPAENMTVINCAASVKHFARGNEIERANVDSVRNLAAWCEANGARLVHVSTCSVAGNREKGSPPAGVLLDESRLFIGQEIDSNQYIHSKFMAERHIYEEILSHGLRAKVLRVGNLAPRLEDGAFQANYETNSFMNTFKAYRTLGLIPFDALDEATEFSPIDCVARAVLALARTPDPCVCFMLLNAHRPLHGDIIRELGEIGHPVAGAEPEDFMKALNEALADETRSGAVSSLIAYQNAGDLQAIGLEGLDSSYTTRVLERLGYSWPETGSAYIRRFLTQLEKKGFFG